jgi:DNA-binding IclR family transcriptional regulator
MTASCYEIGSLVLRIENNFLDRPGLALTLAKVQRRFGIDKKTCAAVLGALVEAQVLTQTHKGAYIRYFPRLAQHAA